jgi:acyl-CoA thioesterase I
LAKFSRKYKKPAIIAGAAVAGALLVGGAAVMTAEATKAKYPPAVSQQVQDYYNQQATAPATRKAFVPAPNKVAFIGDSYSAGTGAAKDQGFVSVLSRQLSLAPSNFAQGGTGYIKRIDAKGEGACGRDVCLNYGEMADKVILDAPAAVVVSGGRNDPADLAAFDAAAHALFAELRAGMPNAKLIATSPVWGADGPPPQGDAMRESVRAAVTAAGGTFVDLGQPFEGRPDLITKDNVHPNDAGHKVLADAVQAGFVAAGVAFS